MGDGATGVAVGATGVRVAVGTTVVGVRVGVAVGGLGVGVRVGVGLAASTGVAIHNVTLTIRSISPARTRNFLISFSLVNSVKGFK